GQRCHFPDRVLERQSALVANIPPEYSRKGAEAAWMRAAGTGRGEHRAIAGDGYLWICQHRPHVILAHRVVDDAHRTLMCGKYIESSISGVGTAVRADLG